ncbi:hypothetical protein BH18THE1_BH18THE1_22730 [soil metagenome]
MESFLKSSLLKDEYIECPMAIIQSALAKTEFKSELNLAPIDSFEKGSCRVIF